MKNIAIETVTLVDGTFYTQMGHFSPWMRMDVKKMCYI